MRKNVTFCMSMLLALLCTVSKGQGYNTTKWRFSDPKQFGFTVLDVHFTNNNVGIAVGGNGGIASTTDGGAKWTYGAFTFLSNAGLITNGSFNDVHMASATVAYAVGSNGMMAKSTNAGKDWSFVTTPFYTSVRSINTCWFLNRDTGYIAGQWNTLDSIPKLYVTRNGGNTWDSIAAPASNGTSSAGYISNPNYPPLNLPITAKGKEIQRIQFSSTGVGYICGGAMQHFPNIGLPSNVTTATCLGTGTALTSTANTAPLLWKFENGILTDYSVSKERLGYNGYPALPAAINCTSRFGAPSSTQQQFRALNIINDSLVVMMSFNNAIVLRVRTGRNDSTQDVNRPSQFHKGRYEILNTGNSGPPAGYPPIPPVNVLVSSNPYHMKRTTSGKLVAAAGQGAMWTSIDTGRNWVREFSLPQGRNYSGFSTWALEILPSGRFITMGQGGVVADSMPGGAFNSSYVYVGSNGNKVDFADCNNGIVTGGGAIAVTTNGGNSWVAKNRQDFINSNYNISGFSYTSLNRAYFAVSNGTLYTTTDQATTLDPIYSKVSHQMNDVVGFGNDTIYAVGYSQFSVPAASRKSTFFRSVNAGATWDTVDIVVSSAAVVGPPAVPAFTAPTLNRIVFPSRLVGYASGSRNGVYKTTNGGTTWTKINPEPTLNEGPVGYPNTFLNITSICALDNNTVFVLGNMFTNIGIKKVYKTIDGGTTWTNITNNMATLLPNANMLNVLFSDANNGYVSGSNVLFVTNNGGTTWRMDVSPHGNLNNAMGFAPRTVPAAIPFANRKLFVAGIAFASGIPSIMEYGDTLDLNVNSTETVVNATCTNLTAGSITVNARGGITPYSYSINGGAFQSSNVFSGLTQGVKTITIKDNFCGTITKTVTVGFTDNLTLTTNNDTSVCAGAPVQMVATSPANTVFAWTPAAGLSNAAISNPVAINNGSAAYLVTATLNGCVKTKTVNIGVRPNPIVNAGADKVILIGDQIQLDGSGANNVRTIAWTPAATLTGANTFTPIAKPTQTTTYTITVVDANSCTSTDGAVVTVIPYCVNPKDAFTPNGDGINDKWVMTTGTTCLVSSGGINVKVYNRYGGLVYANNNYQNDWDGTYGGKLVADGTYYYQVVYKLFNGTSVNAKGNVTILR
jgi:gliding motility-associated-like protein